MSDWILIAFLGYDALLNHFLPILSHLSLFLFEFISSQKRFVCLIWWQMKFIGSNKNYLDQLY